MIVLDASAALAVIKGEAGAETIVDRLAGSLMSSANLAEVLHKAWAMGSAPGEVRKQLMELGISFRNATPDHALRVAELGIYAKANDLSYADRFCIALAEQEGAELLTGDTGIAQTPSTTVITKFR